MDSKVRNRNLCLNQGRTFPIPIKFYQSSSFYIPYRMPMKKTPNESRTEKRVSGNSPPRGFRARWFVLFAAQTQKRGFSSQYLKSDHFQPKSCLYNFPTPLITSYNINFTSLMTLIIKYPNNPFDIQMHKLATCIA